MQEKITAILEGCNHDSPSRIQYCPISIAIPENASVLRVRTHPRLFLYGNFRDFEYSRGKILKPSRESRGWLLREETGSNPEWAGWIFEMPRSITTQDGRIYVNEIFYSSGWEYYFPLIPAILRDCSDFFNGRKSADDLSNLARRAF